MTRFPNTPSIYSSITPVNPSQKHILKIYRTLNEIPCPALIFFGNFSDTDYNTSVGPYFDNDRFLQDHCPGNNDILLFDDESFVTL
jgi:hypothetical protein